MKNKILVIFLLLLFVNLFLGIVPSMLVAFALIVLLFSCLNKYDWAFIFLLFGTIIGAYFATMGTRFIGVALMIPSMAVVLLDLRKRINKYVSLYLPILGFVFICFLSSLVTIGGDYSMTKLSSMLFEVIIFMIAFTHFVFFPEKHKPFLIAISICLMCLFMANYMNEWIGTKMSLNTFLTSFAGFRGNITEYKYNNEDAFIINYQLLGIYGCLAMAFAYMKDTVKTKSLFCLLMVVAFVIVVYSSARQAFVAAIVVSFIAVISSKKMSLKIGLVLVSLLIFGFWMSNIDSDSLSFLLGSTEGKGSERSLVREKAFSDFISAPILGVGFGRFFYNGHFGVNEHNLFVELLVETGILGFGYFIFWLFWPMFSTIKSIKHDFVAYMPYLCIIVIYFIRFMVSSDLRESIILLVLAVLLPYYVSNRRYIINRK